MSSIDQLAARIVRIEREQRAQATTPSLAYSSIEDGGSIDSNADTGATMAQFGGQFDGSFMAASLVGPTPPTPSAPIVTAAIGGLTVRWDGTFTDADFAPMDFTRVEVHVSTVAAFVPNTATTLVATIESPRGALPFIARAVGTYYVAFVARSQSGAAGPKSVTVGPTTVALIDNAALASPVKAQSVHGNAGAFALTNASRTTVLTVTITVPAGFTSAAMTMVSRVYAKNTTGVADFLYSTVAIDGTASGGYPLSTPDTNVDVVARSRLLTGLTPGDTFPITVDAWTAWAPWALQATNAADVDGTILWFR